MSFYAERADLRACQLATDVGLVVWTVLWVGIARAVHAAVLTLAAPGRAVADLGRSVAGDMHSAADAAHDVPVIGDGLARPFRALGQAGTSVGGAGRTAQGGVGHLALLLAGAPDLDVLAARALATAPLPRLPDSRQSEAGAKPIRRLRLSP